jgi:hypothetical protein
VTYAPTLFVTWPSPKERDLWQADIPEELATANYRGVWPSALAMVPAWPGTLSEHLIVSCSLLRVVCDSTNQEVRLAWNETAPALSRSMVLAELSEFKSDGIVPVHSLINFDFAAPQMGIFGTSTHNLRAYVGVEIHGYPIDDSKRSEMAHMVVRLTADMLISGPYAVGIHHLPAHGDQIATVLVTETCCHLAVDHSALELAALAATRH